MTPTLCEIQWCLKNIKRVGKQSFLMSQRGWHSCSEFSRPLRPRQRAYLLETCSSDHCESSCEAAILVLKNIKKMWNCLWPGNLNYHCLSEVQTRWLFALVCAHTVQCETSKMHGPARVYLCYSCYFVTLPRPLKPDVQKHSSSLNTLHLLSRWLHHTANCIFGVPVPPERRLPLLFCRINLWPHPLTISAVSLRLGSV